MADPKGPRVYCNACKRQTRHEAAGAYAVSDEDEDAGLSWGSTYTLLRCCGCETAVLEEDSWFSEDLPERTIRYFPKRQTDDLSPKRYLNLPSTLASVYNESLLSFNAGATLLCSIGLRSLLEGICADKGIQGENLKVKIQGLKELLLNDAIIKGLHHFRFAGNAAAHELKRPRAGEMRAAITVMEDLLNFLYELEYRVTKMAAKPGR